MSEKVPFDDDTMTLIMGLGGPKEPGQHGRRKVPEPEMDTIDLITEIRDLCDEFLMKIGKADSKKQEKPAEDSEDAKETEEEPAEDEEE